MTTDITRIRRLPERGSEEFEVIRSILDEGFLCHVGYLSEGRPVVIPTLYVRDADRVILHGSTSSGITRAVRRGSPLSIAVTLIDGLVVARSGFNSSANYRSVVIHGTGRILEGSEHTRALDITLDKLIPGRLGEVRANTDIEVRQTATIEVPLDDASAKVRSGPPGDDEADIDTDVWAGVVPLTLSAGTPEPAPDLRPGVPVPGYLEPYRRPR